MAKSKLAPNFLLPILQEVVLAGKSVEMLQSLGRLKSVHDGKMCLFSSDQLNLVLV